MFSDLNIDSIIMVILINNKNKLLNHIEIYNNLIELLEEPNVINLPNFKEHFLMKLLELPIKYDNVKLYKTSYNNFPIYKIIYDKIDELTDNETERNNILETDTITNNYCIELLWPNNYSLNKYILNEQNEYINDIIDERTGNNIIHELVINNDIYNLTKILDNDNYYILLQNNNKKSPIILSNSLEISNLYIESAFNKIYDLENKIYDLENKIEFCKEKNMTICEIIINFCIIFNVIMGTLYLSMAVKQL